jgi:hypothetical protein
MPAPAATTAAAAAAAAAAEAAAAWTFLIQRSHASMTKVGVSGDGAAKIPSIHRKALPEMALPSTK